MYTVYMVFIIILIVSFITGLFITLIDSKHKSSKVVDISGGIIIDEEII